MIETINTALRIIAIRVWRWLRGTPWKDTYK